MKYNSVIKGRFVSRPNRFIAMVEIDGVIETVHVKNTGRCKELLVEGATVYLSVSDNPNRKTKFDLIAVDKITDKGVLLINMDSQIPNDVAVEWLQKSMLFSDKAIIKREVFYGKSRFDIYVDDGERKAFIEVKGVTLENGGVTSFPDAPTERGIKHLNELSAAINDGYEAYVLFIIQMKGVNLFEPNRERHSQFADALVNASNRGVKVLAVDCIVTENSIIADKNIDIKLQ